MKIILRWTAFLLVLLLTAALVGLVASQGLRDKAWFALDRAAAHHGGRGLPVAWARLLRPDVPVWVEVEPHVRMLLDPHDYLDRTIMLTGQWEPDTWRGLADHIPQGGVFVDVGAHVGYYSLKAAAQVGPAGRVLAIEPDPATILRLTKNVRESEASQVTIEPVACSSSEGTVEFFSAGQGNTSASSMSKTNAAQGGPPPQSYRVRTRPLDAIVQESGVTRVDVVKIDVEGAELLVLQGAGQTLDRYHPVVAVEMIQEQLKNMGASTAQIVAFFRSHGYAPRHTYGEFGNTEFAFTTVSSGNSK